jgi:hypothetical protein
MKKITSFAFLALFVSLAMAQITAADMPVSGDTVRYKHINKNTFNIMASTVGVGLVWNHSAVVETADTTVYYFVDPSTTPEGALYSGATVAEQTAGVTGAFYYELSGANFYRQGFTSPQLSMVYDNKLKLYQLPFQFGTTFTDSYTGWGFMTGLPDTTIIDNGSYSFDVDGSGTLILPQGYFNDVYRVYYEETFGLKYDLGLGSPMTVASIDEFGYEYWKAGHVKPLLIYYSTSTTDNIQGGTTTTIAVKYDKLAMPDGTVSIEENLVSQISVNPNPCNEWAVVSTPFSKAFFELSDMSGRIVMGRLLDQEETRIDLSALKAGIYMAKVTSAEGHTSVTKLLVR